jgi:hypothetical protein
MRKLFGVTAILSLFLPAIGCESCLNRGAKAPTYPCAPVVEPGCGCAPANGCATCAPAVGQIETMPGPAS